MRGGKQRCMILPKGGKLDKAGGKWYTRQGFGGNKSYKGASKVIQSQQNVPHGGTMKQILTQLKTVSPAAVLGWLERGAAWIHELPYAAARFLPRVPGLLMRGVKGAGRWLIRTETAQEVLAVYRWMERCADSIHEAPYRLAAWLPTVPEKLRRLWQRMAAWMAKKDVTPRLAAFAPLCFAAVVVAFCMQPVVKENVTYLITEGEAPEFIRGRVYNDRRLPGLTLVAGGESRDAQLILDEGQWVSVRVNGHVETVKTRRETVANLLRRMNIPVGEEQMVVLDVSGETPAISVQNTYSFTWQKTVPLAYETEYVSAPLMDKGTEEVVQAGATGGVLETYRNTYRNGDLEQLELLTAVTTEPVTEVIRQGTRVDEVSRDDRIEKVVYNKDGSGYLLFKSGETMTFREKVTCSATAYSIGKWTASGLPTKVGHIAVDTDVFPYHTRFYIFTNDGYLVYGNAVAADCGSAIQGYKIDLWFETYAEACRFGRRDCTVFVLD